MKRLKETLKKSQKSININDWLAYNSVNLNHVLLSMLSRQSLLKSSRFGLMTLSCLSIALAGCQHTIKAPVLSTPVPSQETVKLQFSIGGKIGVRTPQQNGSAFYAWTQVNDRFAIDLTGALGIGQTRIEGTPGQVTLTSAKTGTLEASTPEELLEQATGWQAPISHLVSWIQGKPATLSAQVQPDALNRLSQLNEDGWNVQFSYLDDSLLPQKLLMTQRLDSGENKVTLTIQTRSDAVQP